MKVLRKYSVWLPIVGLFLLSVLPLLYTVIHSLKAEEAIKYAYSHQVPIKDKIWIQPFIVNFEQYYRILFRTPEYLLLFWNSVKIVLPTIALQTLIGVLAAYGFSKLKFKGSETLFFLYIVLMLMPFQVTMVPSYMMVSKLGWLNKLESLIVPGMFGTFSIFFLKQFMEAIDESFLEEARITGANELQILFYIMVPMGRGIIVTVVTLLFIDYWSMLDQPIIFLNQTHKFPLSVYLSTLAKDNIHIGFACSVLYMMLPLLLVAYTGEDLSDGLKITSLK